MSLLGANAGFGGADDPIICQTIHKLRALCAINYSGSILPSANHHLHVDVEFPEVDCDEVHPDIFVGNG
jgi:hypothetical protein